MPTFLNIYDLARAGEAYEAKPGDSSWDEEADINKDGIIDVYDLALCGKTKEKPFKFVLSQIEHSTTKYLNNSKDYSDRVERWE